MGWDGSQSGVDDGRKTSVLVRDCLRQAPVTVPEACTIAEAAELMATHGVGSVLVVSGTEAVGIVTDRDIAVRGVATGMDPASRVDAVMTVHPVTIQGSADLFEAYRTINDAQVRRLPVLEDDDLAGIVTFDDLLVALVLELGAVVSPIARELRRPRRPD
jgi:signal-transduction protein with cAMP-binding, CBS, and nucleotidyltransferase domain